MRQYKAAAQLLSGKSTWQLSGATSLFTV